MRSAKPHRAASAVPMTRHRTMAAWVGAWFCMAPAGAFAALNCGVSTPGLAFGGYDVYNASVTNGNGTLSVNCSITLPSRDANVSYTVSLSTGSSNSFVQRQMKSGAATLGYNLYTSNAYSIVWGDGTGTTHTVSGTMKLNGGNPSQTNMHTVYGQIPALQDAAVAPNYSDSVTVTVNY